MSLASVLYPGPTARGLDEFFFANFEHHQSIISAIKDTRGVVLEMFQIYPVVSDGDLTTWARQHQRQHDTMNALLGIPGVDLTGIDLKDKKAFDSWAYQHFQQHQAAGQLCGLPI